MANPAANLVPVAIHGWSPTAYGMWGVLLLQVVVLTGYLIKRGPEYISQWSAAKRMGAETDREDRAADAAEKARAATAEAAAKKEITDRLNSLEDRIQRQGQAMSFIMNAAVTSTNALEAISPDHIAIKQSRELIGLAASALGNEDSFSKALAQLASVPPVEKKK